MNIKIARLLLAFMSATLFSPAIILYSRVSSSRKNQKLKSKASLPILTGVKKKSISIEKEEPDEVEDDDSIDGEGHYRYEHEDEVVSAKNQHHHDHEEGGESDALIESDDDNDENDDEVVDLVPVKKSLMDRDMHKHPDSRGKGEYPGQLLFSRVDTELFLKGRIRQEYFKGTRTITMNSTFPDKYNFFRSRADIEFYSRHGRERFGKTAVEGSFKISSFVNWRFEDIYTGADGTDPFIDGNASNGFWAVQQLPHRHKSHVPMVFMEEGWLRVHFDTLYEKVFKGRPHWLQAGYFPFKVGRGISLGDAYEGGICYMGWARPSVATFTGYTPPHAPHLPPGILFEGTLYDWLKYDIYFSKWRATSAFPWTVDDGTHGHLINSKDQVLFGKTQDADHWAAKLKAEIALPGGLELYFEPYYVNLKSPQHTIERPGDSAVYLNTVGLMVDGHYHNVTFNVEAAVQCGRFEMHDLDRNRWIYAKDGDSGIHYARATHIFEHNLDPEFNESLAAGHGEKDNALLQDPANRTKALAVRDPLNDDYAIATDNLVATVLQTNYNRLDGLNNGDPIINGDDGTYLWSDPRYYSPAKVVGQRLSTLDNDVQVPNDNMLAPDAEQSADIIITKAIQQNRILYNAVDNIRYGGDRFRKAYDLNLKGWMGLMDIAYEFDAVPVKLNFGCGIISGDSYPFNMGEEVNKNYHGFLPLRDINYQGHFIKSLAIFTYRLMPRPVNADFKDMYARNHTDDSSNLRLIGLGVEWYPTRKKEQLRLSSNLIWFWEDATLKKWDVNGIPSNPVWAEIATNSFLIDSGNVGWLSDQNASKQLGTEWNIGIDYWPTESCDIVARLGVFVPGQLYKDLDGQANLASFTYRPDDSLMVKSLGTDYAWAWNIRIGYRF